MKKRALITGITGQDGSYLAKLLLSKDYEVFGFFRRTSTNGFERIEHLLDKIYLIPGEMIDQTSLIYAIKESQPQEIYNLAAQSFVESAFETAVSTAETNGVGVVKMLEAIRFIDPKIRFYQASTSEMYGKIVEMPQTEKTPFYPRSPYGTAKLYAHWATINYREAYDLHASCGILFNHESPKRGEEFVTRKISKAVARIALGFQNEIRLGNIESKRDWGFAGDYVEAMWLMLQQTKPDDYVIASGETHSVKEFLTEAFKEVGISDFEKYVVIDPEFFRPAEVDLLLGNPEKAKKVLNWEPKVTFKELVKMMVSSDLEKEKLIGEKPLRKPRLYKKNISPDRPLKPLKKVN